MMLDSEIKELLSQAKIIAVVGCSSNPLRPSFGVSRFLQRLGYRIIPVNPNETEVLGERAYASLRDVPEKIDIVNIFRRPSHVLQVVEDALTKSVRCIWMQEGIVNLEAAQRAESQGIPVVMDRCILKEIACLL